MVDPYICTLIQTTGMLNYTARSKDPTNANIGHIYYAIPIANDNIKDLSIGENAWLPYNVEATPFTFMTIYKNVPSHFQTILQPLSIPTLMFTLLSIASISTFLTFTSAKTFENFSKVILCLIGALLDQSDCLQSAMTTKVNKFAPICWIVWSTWLLTSWQISGVYKSSIFSYLSASPTPQYPMNLEDLIKSGMHLMTMSSISEIDTTTNKVAKTVSNFREITLAEMMSVMEAEGRNSSQLFRTLENVYKRIEWYKKMDLEFMLRKVLNGSSDLPEKFVIVDDQETVENTRVLLTVFSRRWVSPPVALPIFMTRNFWVTSRNFFYPPFVQILSRIYESGLYGRWTVGGKYKVRQDKIKLLAAAASKKHELQANRKVDGKRFFNYLLHQESGSKSVVDVKTVSRGVYRNVGLTCLWLSLLATCVWGVEFVIKGRRCFIFTRFNKNNVNEFA
ncbi:unnamed protein product [Orchesella dallaii]|uniref:Uncharacterized protein n=1 Tax=Orchesella dallaii TaxID=48710 RepID=A0ABP1QBX6_9HEXA